MTNSNTFSSKWPTFLYVGAARTGSSWMYEILREHPEVYVPRAKDIFYYNRAFDRGVDWYLSFFQNARGEKARGELSHDYFLKEEYAECIYRDLPDIKIIACLREGVDRTFSEYLYDQTVFQHVTASEYRRGMMFAEFAGLPRIVKLSSYYENLKPFYRLYDRERILVLFFDDLNKDPVGFAKELFRFLEVDPTFVPHSLHRRVYAARSVRSDLLAALAYKGGQLLRKLGRPGVLGSMKHKDWFDNLLYKRFGDKKPRIPREAIGPLREIYHRDMDKLADLIGRPLPEAWSRTD